MKKVSLFFFLLFCILDANVFARTYDVSQLPIVVRNIIEWSNEYPTVINDWRGMFVQSVDGELPPLLSVVVSLNGKSTKGMKEEEFNDILMSQSKSKIEYLVKKEGVNVKKECTIQYHNSIYWVDGIILNEPEVFPENIAIKNLKNASVFSFNTFTFKTGNIMEIDELAVMEAAGKSLSKLGFKKSDDGKKADLILELSKAKDNYNGNKVTLSIKDGTNKNKSVERILWSIDVTDLNGDMKRQESALKTALYKQCTNFPFDIPTYSQSISTVGVAFESKEAVCTGKTLEILKNSDAYEKGLRSGDAIVGAYSGAEFQAFYISTRRYYFKPNKRNRQKNWTVDMFFYLLPIIPHYTRNNANTYLTEDVQRGNYFSTNHFKVRNSYGKKFTVAAPFESRTFHFKYIR